MNLSLHWWKYSFSLKNTEVLKWQFITVQGSSKFILECFVSTFCPYTMDLSKVLSRGHALVTTGYRDDITRDKRRVIRH